MKTGELCFEDSQGKTKPVEPDALADLFELVSEQVNCVVLNACYSEIQAKAIAKHIPFVIGMNQAIGDKAAVTFASGFYKALGGGRSFEDAYKFACVELRLEGIPEHLTPVLVDLSSEKKLLIVEDKFRYSNEAKADVDFSLVRSDHFGKVISALKSYDWATQRPAVYEALVLDWSSLSADDIFVLGRNLYQCACGEEWRAKNLMCNLRQELARLPINAAEHILNGMFYEVYFDSYGKFRREELKSMRMANLFAVQSVQKHQDSCMFIRRALEPYQNNLAVLPNTSPEIVEVVIEVSDKKPLVLKSVRCLNTEWLIDSDIKTNWNKIFTMRALVGEPFTSEKLKHELAEKWYIPFEQIKILSNVSLPSEVEMRLPEGKIVDTGFVAWTKAWKSFQNKNFSNLGRK